MVSTEVNIYPNPFTEYVTIAFGLQNKANVRLNVFDINGRLIAHIRNSEAEKGNYKLQWNGTSDTGARVSNGTYIIQLEAGELRNSSRVIIQR